MCVIYKMFSFFIFFPQKSGYKRLLHIQSVELILDVKEEEVNRRLDLVDQLIVLGESELQLIRNPTRLMDTIRDIHMRLIHMDLAPVSIMVMEEDRSHTRGIEIGQLLNVIMNISIFNEEISGSKEGELKVRAIQIKIDRKSEIARKLIHPIHRFVINLRVIEHISRNIDVIAIRKTNDTRDIGMGQKIEIDHRVDKPEDRVDLRRSRGNVNLGSHL